MQSPLRWMLNMVPKGDDFVEMPLAEQFKTIIEGSKIKTSPTESV